MYNRREMRSESPMVALSMFLIERRRRLGAEALVVATDDGLLIGGEGEGDLPLIAAASALESVGRGGRALLGDDAAHLAHASILVDGTRIVIATVGVEHSESVGIGVERILRAA
jgi:hypothetical protein